MLRRKVPFYYEEWYVYNPIQHDLFGRRRTGRRRCQTVRHGDRFGTLTPLNRIPPTATHTNVITAGFAQEHCDVAAYTQSAYYYRRTADTEMSFATGGLLGVRGHCWCIFSHGESLHRIRTTPRESRRRRNKSRLVGTQDTQRQSVGNVAR